MSVAATTAVYSLSRTKGATRLVLLAIADCANSEGVAWPSIDTIRRKAGFETPRNVQKHIKKLLKTGELTREERAGPHGTNLYQITLLSEQYLKKIWDGNPPRPDLRNPVLLDGAPKSSPVQKTPSDQEDAPRPFGPKTPSKRTQNPVQTDPKPRPNGPKNATK